MEIHTVKCDICGIERQATNHWFKIYLHGGMLTIAVPMRIEGTDFGAGPTLHPERVLDCCGVGCASRAFSEFMNKAVGAKSKAPAGASLQ